MENFWPNQSFKAFSGGLLKFTYFLLVDFPIVFINIIKIQLIKLMNTIWTFPSQKQKWLHLEEKNL